MNIQTLRDVEGIEANPPVGGPLAFETSLVVPPDYTPGTEMILRLHVLKLDYPPSACSIDLAPNSAHMYRPSTGANLNDDVLNLTDGLGDPPAITFDAVFEQVRTIDITISQPGSIPIQPGGSMTLGMAVTLSTCTPSDVGIHSAAVYYD